MPNAIAPTSPTAVVTVPTIATRLKQSVVAAVSTDRNATMTIHDITSEPTSVAALRR